MIGDDGAVYEGRGWNVMASHTRNYNERGYGVAFIGQFENTLPTQKAMQAFHKFAKV